MKLWALLKDSYREAVDRKIFLVMLILSGLLTLFVLSISYRMLTVDEELNSFAGLMTFTQQMNPHLGHPKFSIENFEQTNQATEPWNGNYRFDWVVSADDAEKLKQVPMTSEDEVREHVMPGPFRYLKDPQVSSNLSKDPKQVRYTISTTGTNIKDAPGWRYELKVLFFVPVPVVHMSIREAVYFIEDKLVNGFGAWVAVLIGVIITASFIPNQLQKGAVELVASKPIHRVQFLIFKYLGGLVFVFLLTAATVVMIWTAIGVRSGIWSTGFLLVIPAVTFYFALLYSVSTLTAVLTRSTVVAILVTCAVWFVLWLNGVVHSTLDGFRKSRETVETMVRASEQSPSEAPAGDGKKDKKARSEPSPPPNISNWVYQISDFFYTILPRTRDLDDLTAEWVAQGVLSDEDKRVEGFHKEGRPKWLDTVGVSVAFIAVMLGLACWKFARTDY